EPHSAKPDSLGLLGSHNERPAPHDSEFEVVAINTLDRQVIKDPLEVAFAWVTHDVPTSESIGKDADNGRQVDVCCKGKISHTTECVDAAEHPAKERRQPESRPPTGADSFRH